MSTTPPISPAPPPVSGSPFGDNPKATAKAAKAYAKAQRPWYKKKRFIIPLAFVVLIIIMVAAGGGGEDEPDTATNPSDDTKTAQPSNEEEPEEPGDEVLFPGRPDAQGDDQERNIGGSAELSGYTATVTAASFQQTLSDFEDGGYIVVDVTIDNRDDGAQPYNLFDWRLQTPNGQVIDPTFTTGDMLGSGDLVGGGTVSGRVVFEVGDAKGDFFIVYKPDAFDGARGIWMVTA